MFITPVKSLALWVLLPEQESYLSYIKKYIKYIFKDIEYYWPISRLNLDYKIYTRIPKTKMQKTLDTIIGKNQSAAVKNRNILRTLCTIRDIIDVSNTLIDLSRISIFLLCKNVDIEKKSFTWLTLHTPAFSIRFKINFK